LCPRPETEELVMRVVESVEKPDRILDIGCGTGCIGIALADLLPSSQVIALDIEPIAIATAEENAEAILGTDWKERYRATLTSAEDYELSEDADPFDVIVSNPPYIPAADMKTLDANVVQFESEAALCGGHDGLDVIRIIVRKLPSWCRTGAICWMEVDPSHPSLLQTWLENEGNELGVEFESHHKDIFGLDRFVKLRIVRGR